MQAQPPQIAERLARWSLARSERQGVLGDMQEEFAYISARSGVVAAERWYWRQTLRSIVPNAFRRARNDERRRKRLRAGCWWTLMGLVGVAVVIRNRHDGIDILPVTALWLPLGIWNMARAVFATRPRLRPIQQQVLAWPFGAALLAGASVELIPSLHARQLAIESMLLAAAMAMGLVIELWPRWPDPAPPKEFSVWIDTELIDGKQRRMTMVVPNAPLGLSGMVLCNGNAAHRVRALGGILQRKFSSDDTVHIYAALNGVESAAHVTMQVIDASDRVAQAFPADIDSNGIERVRQIRDEDLADDDAPVRQPIEHFGRIDVALPLAKFQPGPYRVRLTVQDGTHASVKQDEFVVTPPADALA